MEQRIAYLGGNHAPDDGTARTAWHIGKADDSALILPTSTWRKRYVTSRYGRICATKSSQSTTILVFSTATL
jgi:hypothetical protein